ncbi:Hydroxyethylthiazole kinase [Dichomitus squalens LYAD-421 SS1]|uniref:Hydroxyethylthiazole kinase n=1 Tax=Dichomitus squalens (strain LYAD-421) TaxID=732165 RepID=UPI0004415050|nr:Hydroxyethylthiazole kinase [Dichomitus squalens LYAD-421 SS1]EJF65143.1 Hydroxyethylthiazole kinase [Dichomitus squalens LYAD-421 SS1]
MVESKLSVDYSLYLVTGRDLLPNGKDYLESLEESIQGGVTLVQIREKHADTGEFLQIARASKEICRRYNVPILINDRVDIALAIGADGVHLGQTDMPVDVARKLLPSTAIIGMTCNTVEHVKKAVEDGVDYVGIGPVWATQTKKLTSPAVGVRGLGPLLEALEGTDVKAVSIAGIKSTNALHCLHGAVSIYGRSLDGLAVVSDIVASTDPYNAAKKIAGIVHAFKASPLPCFSTFPPSYASESVKRQVGELLSAVKRFSPLVHQITNTVVTTQSANATIALGASPIMATAPEEMGDLGKVAGSLLVNFGTIQNLDGMLVAGFNYNLKRKPVVFDPVGIGATTYRRTSATTLLNAWQATVIKGNSGELAALANSQEVQAKGVDSVGQGFADPVTFVRNLARKERAIIVLTGITDYVSDGTTVVRLSNGHPYLGEITGSGCMVGTAVATFCAGANLAEEARRSTNADTAGDAKLVRGDMLVAAVGGVLAITVASELAAARADVQGSGTFLPALIDELGALTPEKLATYGKVDVM